MEALAWAAKQPVTPVSRKYVLSTLADKANGDGECWPTIAAICEVTGLKERMVRYHLKALAADGYVSSKNRGREPSMFTLNLTGNPLPVREIDNRQSIAPTPQLITGNPLPDKQPLSGNPLPVKPLSGNPLPVEAADKWQPIAGYLAPLSPLTIPLNPQKTLKTKENLFLTEESKEIFNPSWISDLYRLGWAAADPLDQRQIHRLVNDFGSLDLVDEVERFVNYWSKQSRPKTWATYLRLRTWFGNAKNRISNGNRQGYGRLPRKPGDLSIAANA